MPPTQRPRVLFVLPATVMGGAEIRLLAMLSGFTRIEPVLLGHRGLRGIDGAGIETHYLDDQPGCTDPYSYAPANVLSHAGAIAAVARMVRPHTTFGWMHQGSFFVAAAGSLHRLRSRLAGCILGPPTDHFRFLGRRPTLYERFLFGFAGRRLHRLVVPSHGVRQDLIANFSASPRRLQVVHNGIDLEAVRRKALDPLPASAPRKERPWIVSASRLSPEKALDVLLEAFVRLRRHLDADLVLLGEGPDRPRVERLACEMGVAANVILPGFQPNPFPWIARSEVFAQASRLEGFGNALVEAMALGIPVVSTACRWGPIEILAEPGSGLLVPVDNPAELGVALERVLRDNNLRRSLSEAGRRRADAFAFERMLDGYEHVICGGRA